MKDEREALGSLVLKMLISIPSKSAHPKHKFVVIARNNCCTVAGAKEFKDDFLEINPHLSDAIVEGEWNRREYI